MEMNMKYLTAVLLCFGLTSCAGIKSISVDPIGARVEKLEASNGLWLNGGSPEIDLPQNAKPKEVIAEAIRKQPFDQGMIKSYQVETIRQVDIFAVRGREQYTTALLKTDFGPKVIVFNFKTFGHWWVRFYSVTKEKQNK